MTVAAAHAAPDADAVEGELLATLRPPEQTTLHTLMLELLPQPRGQADDTGENRAVTRPDDRMP